jgi:hypothetical protein
VGHALVEALVPVARLVARRCALGVPHVVRPRVAQLLVVRRLVVLRRVVPLHEERVQWIASVRCQRSRSQVRQQCAQVLRPCRARPLSLGQ